MCIGHIRYDITCTCMGSCRRGPGNVKNGHFCHFSLFAKPEKSMFFRVFSGWFWGVIHGGGPFISWVVINDHVHNPKWSKMYRFCPKPFKKVVHFGVALRGHSILGVSGGDPKCVQIMGVPCTKICPKSNSRVFRNSDYFPVFCPSGVIFTLLKWERFWPQNYEILSPLWRLIKLKTRVFVILGDFPKMAILAILAISKTPLNKYYVHM